MNILDISRQKVDELFPNENWTEVYLNVFVAQGRKPINSEQEKVFQKELLMAKIASDNSHVVYLLPEKCIVQNRNCLLLCDLQKNDVLLEDERFKINKAPTNQCPLVAPGWNSRTRTPII